MLEKNISDILKQNESIRNASNKINELCEKTINNYINEIEEKHYDLTIHKYVFINEITNSETLMLDDAVASWKDNVVKTNGCYHQLINLIDNAI